MDGPGNWYLYKMRWTQKTVQNDRASTKTGDSWWIEKFEAISIMFGGHMSMYKNKDSFCRHVPGHADPLRFLQMSQDTPTSSNKNLYKMTSTFSTCPRIPPQVRTRISTKWVYGKMNLQSDPTLYKNSLYKMTAHFSGKTLPGTEWWFMPGTCPPILCRKFQGGLWRNCHLGLCLNSTPPPWTTDYPFADLRTPNKPRKIRI